jgi:hypothetical protein
MSWRNSSAVDNDSSSKLAIIDCTPPRYIVSKQKRYVLLHPGTMAEDVSMVLFQNLLVDFYIKCLLCLLLNGMEFRRRLIHGSNILRFSGEHGR